MASAPPITTVVVDQFGHVVTVPTAVKTGVVVSGAGPQGPPGIDGSLSAAKIPDWVANVTVQPNEVRRLPDGSVGRWIGPVGNTGATFDASKWTKLTGTSAQTIFVDDYVNQPIYATVFDACQAALDAAVALTATAPVSLEFGARTYDINKGTTYLTGGQNLGVTDGLVNWLRITGKGKATIKLGVGTPGFIGPKTSNTTGKTYGKLEIDGFFIDANNASASAIGIVTQWNGPSCNLTGFHIHDIIGINGGALANGSGRRWISLNVTIATAFDVANQYTIDDIKIERVDFTGGNTGALITAYCSASPSDNQWWGQTIPAANVILDRIVVRDMKWDSKSTFYGSIGSAGCQVGADGLTKNVLIEDCIFKNGGDVGVEIGGIRDGLIRNVYCENFTNEAFFLSNNHGGLPNPERQHVKFESCTAVASEPRMTSPMAGFALECNHESKMGFVEYENCTFRHIAGTFLQSANGQFQGSPTPPFSFRGAFVKISVRHCSVLYDNLAVVFSSTLKNFTPATIDLNQSGEAGILEVKDLNVGYQGSIDSAGNSGCAMQVDGMRLRGTRLYLDIDGFHFWTNITRLGSSIPTVRFRDVSLTSPTSYDDPLSSNSLAEDYVVDAGVLSDLTTTSTPVRSVANHTVRKMFKAPSLANAGGLNNRVGQVLDSSTYAEATAPTTTPQGFELLARCRITTDNQYELRAVVDDDGTNSHIRIEKVQAGVVTVLVGPTNLTRITAGQVVGLRLMQRGDIVTADYYNGTAGRTVNLVGDTRVTYTLGASEARRLRGAGAPGYVGFGWTPGDATSTLTRFRADAMGVFTGHIRGLTPLQHMQDVSTSNAVLGGDSTRVRVENPPLKFEWQRAAVSLHGAAELSGGPDATFRGQMLVEPGSVWGAPPVPATIVPTGSPFIYTNQDAYIEDVAIYGGTLATPFVELSKDSGVTWSQIVGVSGEKMVRLSPGDQVRVTYSAVPTMRKIPVL